MPIYMQVDGIKGRVTAEGHDFARADDASGKTYYVGTANGGVWKTANFLTQHPGAVELSRISFGALAIDDRDALPTMKAVQLFNAARLVPNGKLYVATDAGVYAGAANNRGQLVVGVDNVQLRDPLTGKTRLVFGSDQGVWRSGGGGLNGHNTGALRNVSNNNTGPVRGGKGALMSLPGINAATRPGVGVLKSTASGRTWRSGARMSCSNNLKQMGIGIHNVASVAIFVSDMGSAFGKVFRLRNATVSSGPTGTATINFTGLE